MKMNETEVKVIKDKEVNDEDWCCMVVILMESNPGSRGDLDLYQQTILLKRNTIIHNISPEDLKSFENMGNEVSSAPTAKRKEQITKSKTIEQNFPSSFLQAISLKRYILEYKEKDLKKRAGKTRQELSSGIISQDIKTLLSEQDYGSFCYFTLTKFYDCFLINYLIELNVPLVAIFEIVPEMDRKRQSSIGAGNRLEESKRISQLVNNFWINFQEQLKDPLKRDMFAQILVLPIYLTRIPFYQTSLHNEKRGGIICEYLTSILFSINEKMRHYIHYINNAEVIDAPHSDRSVDNTLYMHLMESIPLECVTIEFLVNSLIEQVVKNCEEDDFQHEDIVDEITKIDNVTDVQERKCSSLFIYHRDYICRKSFHLKSNVRLALHDISTKMNSMMPYASAWKLYPPQTEIQMTLNANQVLKLITCCNENITEDKFVKLLHLLFFNRLQRNSLAYKQNSEKTGDYQVLVSLFDSVEKRGKQVEDICDIPADNKKEITKRDKQVNALKKFLMFDEFDSLIKGDLREDLLSFYYTEDLKKGTLLQCLNKAYNSFLNLSHEYCPLTDKLMLWFYNSCDENGLNSSIQYGLLNTTIGFGDFYVHPNEEAILWLKGQQEEIKSIDSRRRKVYISKHFPDVNPLTFVLNPNIRIKVPFPTIKYFERNSNKEPYVKVFNGFGFSRNKILEEIKTFFSVDGPHLTFKKSKWLGKHGNLTITLNSHDHLITYHQILEEDNNREVRCSNNNNTKFCIQSNKGIIFSFFVKNSRALKNDDDSMNFDALDTEIDHYETSITLPNGLMIEIFNGKYNYIKQRYLVKNHLDDILKLEDFRLYLNNGTIIVFMCDGSIIILYSNTTETRIKIIGQKHNRKQSFNEKTKGSLNGNSSLEEIYNNADDTVDEEYAFEIIRHEVIGWNGHFVRYNMNQKIQEERRYQLRASFSSKKGLCTERSDGTKCFVDCDGVLTAVFRDKSITKIIPVVYSGRSDPSNSSISNSIDEIENSFEVISLQCIMSHPYYMKNEFFSEKWIIHLPFDTTLVASKTDFDLILDNHTKVFYGHKVVSVVSSNLVNNTKKTISNIFFERKEVDEYTICTVLSSEGKAFCATNKGKTATIKKWSDFKNIEGSNLFEERTMSESAIFWPDSNAHLPLKKKESFAEKHIKNQNLNSQVTCVIQVPTDLNFSNSRHIIPRQYIKTKKIQRLFVLDRDFSGYEYVNKRDNMLSLMKFESNFKTFQRFLRYKTVVNDTTVCQAPLAKKWNLVFLTKFEYSTLDIADFKKCDLSVISLNQTWLYNSSDSTSERNEKTFYENKYPVDSNSIYPPAILIRRTKNNTPCNIDVWELFKIGVKKYNETNFSTICKIVDHLIPDIRTKSQKIDSEFLCETGIEEIFTNARRYNDIYLEKGESITSSFSTETTAKTVASIQSEKEIINEGYENVSIPIEPSQVSSRLKSIDL